MNRFLYFFLGGGALCVLLTLFILPIPDCQVSQNLGSYQFQDSSGHYLSSNLDREFVAVAGVPYDLIALILLAEDKRFYEHSGVDSIATTRAFVNLFKITGKVSGASTLSQQLVRMHFKYPREFLYKPLVMLHALKLEWFLSKGEILEAYLNLLPFSHQKIGVKTAASFYFNKDLQSLDLNEKATLAALIKSPSALSSNKLYAKLLKTKNSLLKKYFEVEEFDDWKKSYYLAQEIDFLKIKRRSNSFLYTDFLKKHRGDRKGIIRTTLDLNLQQVMEKIVYNRINDLKEKNVTNGALLVIDNSDGSVLSYVGSFDFFDKEFGKIDAIQNKRQPGSALKPFTYSLALQSGYHLGSILPDIPMYFSSGGGSYRPRNYSMSYHGPVLIREALASSLNIPALYLTDQLGVRNLKTYLESFDLKFLEDADHYGIGLTLGNAELSLWELTKAYTAFSNRGNILKMRLFSDQKMEKKETLLHSDSADLINDILSDNYARELSFGRENIFKTPYHLAVKTGTSTLFRDNWAIGYNRKYTVGVWVGNMNQEEMYNVSGIVGAGPILREAFDHLMNKRKSRGFKMASSIKKIKICASSGLIPNTFCPDQRDEFFGKDHQQTGHCGEHQEIVVRNCRGRAENTKLTITKYNSFFHAWAKTQNIATMDDQIKLLCDGDNYKLLTRLEVNSEESDVEIVSPVSGSLYGLDPNIPAKFQKLQLRLMGKARVKKVEWVFNNKKMKMKEVDNYYLEIQKGKHKLRAEVELENGQKVKRSVEFTVI